MRYIFLVNVGLALLMIGLTVPMIMRWVKPNTLYGFRTSKTMSNESIWYAANRFAGFALAVAGLVIGSGSLVLFRVAGDASSSWSAETTILLFLSMLFVPLLGAAGASLLYSRKL